MYKNPFNIETQNCDHDLYWKAYLIGKRDGIKKQKNVFLRRFPVAYKWGYANGYIAGLEL